MKSVFFFPLFAALAVSAWGAEPAPTRDELLAKFKNGAWTDDALVQLYKTFKPGEEKAQEKALRAAIPQPKFPDEGRPSQFFDTLAVYFDKNGDGRFNASELNASLQNLVDRYYDLLRDSQQAAGPQQALATDFRVKTWKLMQKLALMKKEMQSTKKAAWNYKKFQPVPASEGWDKEHTIVTASAFQQDVCESSKKKPVIVKFGSTNCADCMMMEFNQGIHALAKKVENDFDVKKVWWGPNVAKEMDTLRKAEGVNSSPTFVIYKDGKRFPCGFGFPDQEGKGLEKCLSQTLDAGKASSGECGSG